MAATMMDLGPAAEITGGHPRKIPAPRPERRRKRARRCSGNPSAEHGAREDVATELVGAEPVSRYRPVGDDGEIGLDRATQRQAGRRSRPAACNNTADRRPPESRSRRLADGATRRTRTRTAVHGQGLIVWRSRAHRADSSDQERRIDQIDAEIDQDVTDGDHRDTALNQHHVTVVDGARQHGGRRPAGRRSSRRTSAPAIAAADLQRRRSSRA